MKRSELAAGLALDEEGRVVYAGTDCRLPLRLRLRGGEVAPYYFIKGCFVRTERMQEALRTGDHDLLDAPLPRERRAVRVRDVEIAKMRKQGATYQAIADHFSITPQRVYSIIKRLSALDMS